MLRPATPRASASAGIGPTCSSSRFNASSACSFDAPSGTAPTARRSASSVSADRQIALERRHRHHQALLHLWNLDVEEHAVAVEHEPVRACLAGEERHVGAAVAQLLGELLGTAQHGAREDRFHHANRVAAVLGSRRYATPVAARATASAAAPQAAPARRFRSAPASGSALARRRDLGLRRGSGPAAPPSVRTRRRARPASPRLLRILRSSLMCSPPHRWDAVRYSDSIESRC